MSELPLCVVLIAKAGQEQALHQALLTLVPTTRAEEGCLQYDLFRDNENGRRFVLIERWQNRALWEAHMNMPHLKHFSAISDRLVEEWTLMQLSQLA
jgi:quinol monooxygenase YgiN